MVEKSVLRRTVGTFENQWGHVDVCDAETQDGQGQDQDNNFTTDRFLRPIFKTQRDFVHNFILDLLAII